MKHIITPISIFILLATSIIPAFAGNMVAEIEYFYSDDGTIIGKAFNGKRVNFEYDLRGQLLAVKDASGNDLERYTYDPAGNRLSKTINGVTTTYSYDEANQLIRSTVNGEITYYEYDAAGRMIQAGDKSYIYNGNNKVIEVRQNGETIAKFEYNIDGQIAKAIYGDKKEEFIWDGLALIWRSGVTYINEPYVTGGNPVMAGDDVLFNDMLGSTLAVNDKAVEMTSFGETDNENAFFTGKPMIDELGYSFLFRDYNPNHGKWTTSDPLGYPDGWNQLAYCNNGVTSAVDLWGCLVVYTWEYQGSSTAWGHASMTLTNGTHISWWPESDVISNGVVIVTNSHIKLATGYIDIYSAVAVSNVTFQNDIDWEDSPPNSTNVIEGLNEAAIQNFWDNFATNSLWESYNQNCAKTVADALKAGGAQVSWYDWWSWWNIVWTPNDVKQYADAIQSYYIRITEVRE